MLHHFHFYFPCRHANTKWNVTPVSFTRYNFDPLELSTKCITYEHFCSEQVPATLLAKTNYGSGEELFGFQSQVTRKMAVLLLRCVSHYFSIYVLHVIISRLIINLCNCSKSKSNNGYASSSSIPMWIHL